MDYLVHGNLIQLNEEELQNIINADVKKIKSWKYYNNFAEFNKPFVKEYGSYAALFESFNKYEVGLDVNIYLDGNTNYIYRSHPMMLFIENRYASKGTCDYIPIAIHPYQPFILDENIELKVSDESIERVFGFIRENYYVLFEHANARTDFDYVWDYFDWRPLTEGRLCEMSVKINKNKFNLPADLWSDTTDRTTNHWKRIKFNDRNNSDSNTWASMTIDKYDPKISNLSPKSRLSPRDIEKIRDFVRVNHDTLLKAAMGEYDSDRKFLQDLMPLDKRLLSFFADENDINVECSWVGERLFVIVDGRGRSKEYIEELAKIPPFMKNDDNSAFIDVVGNRKYTGEEMAEKIKHKLYQVAKNKGLHINLTHTARLKENIEFARYRHDIQRYKKLLG